MSSDLRRLRADINSIDQAIISALAKRADFERKIGAYKRKHAIPLLDAKRKRELERLWVHVGRKRGLAPQLVRKVFALVHQHSLSVQRKTK